MEEALILQVIKILSSTAQSKQTSIQKLCWDRINKKNSNQKSWSRIFTIVLSFGYISREIEDGRFIKAGYFMDTLTSVRVINLHRLVPRVIPLIQSIPVLGRTLSFKGGDEVPTVFNSDIEEPFEDVVFGISRVFGFTKS